MVIQGKDIRPCTMDSEISYKRWLVERVRMVKLPSSCVFLKYQRKSWSKNKNQKNKKSQAIETRGG